MSLLELATHGRTLAYHVLQIRACTERMMHQYLGALRQIIPLFGTHRINIIIIAGWIKTTTIDADIVAKLRFAQVDVEDG